MVTSKAKAKEGLENKARKERGREGGDGGSFF